MFWTLVALIKDRFPPRLYDSRLSGSQVIQEILFSKILSKENAHKVGLAPFMDFIERQTDLPPINMVSSNCAYSMNNSITRSVHSGF